MRRAIYILMMLTIWIISMGLIVLFLDSLLEGKPTLGWFIFAGGVGAAISTVALAEEVVEVLHRKAPGPSEERTGLKSLSEFFAALRPSRPALPPPVGKRRRFGRDKAKDM